MKYPHHLTLVYLKNFLIYTLYKVPKTQIKLNLHLVHYYCNMAYLFIYFILVAWLLLCKFSMVYNIYQCLDSNYI